MKSPLFVSAFAAGLLLAGQAYALTLTNNEATQQDVVVIIGGQEEALSIGPGEALEGVCSASCILRLSDGSEYELDSEDQVALEDGTLFVDDEPKGVGAAESDQKEKKL